MISFSHIKPARVRINQKPKLKRLAERLAARLKAREAAERLAKKKQK